MPEVVVKEVLVPVDPDLLLIHEVSIPHSGDNAVLWDQLQKRTAAMKQYENQMKAIRETQHE